MKSKNSVAERVNSEGLTTSRRVSKYDHRENWDLAIIKDLLKETLWELCTERQVFRLYGPSKCHAFLGAREIAIHGTDHSLGKVLLKFQKNKKRKSLNHLVQKAGHLRRHKHQQRSLAFSSAHWCQEKKWAVKILEFSGHREISENPETEMPEAMADSKSSFSRSRDKTEVDRKKVFVTVIWSILPRCVWALSGLSAWRFSPCFPSKSANI